MNIFKSLNSTIQTRPGIRVPTTVAPQQTFHVPSPVRIGSPIKSLPVIAPHAPLGTEEVTTIIRDQRVNPGVFEFLSGVFQRAKK